MVSLSSSLPFIPSCIDVGLRFVPRVAPRKLLTSLKALESRVLKVSPDSPVPQCPANRNSLRTDGKSPVWYGPGKAANCGGVAVSGLEMSQNSQRTQYVLDSLINHNSIY
jgi:hypothetical protein